MIEIARLLPSSEIFWLFLLFGYPLLAAGFTFYLKKTGKIDPAKLRLQLLLLTPSLLFIALCLIFNVMAKIFVLFPAGSFVWIDRGSAGGDLIEGLGTLMGFIGLPIGIFCLLLSVLLNFIMIVQYFVRRK